MTTSLEIAKQIEHVETLKGNFIDLVRIGKDKIASVCTEESTKWMYNNSTEFVKSKLLSYFSFDQHLPSDGSWDPETVAKNVFSHPMLVFVILFLIIFFFIYLISFTLYCKCGRRSCSFFTCGLLLSQKKKNGKPTNKKSTQVGDIENRSSEKGGSKTGNEEEEAVEAPEGMVASELEQNENMDTFKSQNEKEEIPQSNADMRRVITKLIVYFFSLLLLGTVIILYINTTYYVEQNGDYLVKDVCGVIRTTELLLVGKCDADNITGTDGSTNITACFSVTEALTDGLSILNKFKEVITGLESQNLLTKGQNILILQEVQDSIDKLKALDANISRNSTYLSTNYKHRLFLEEHVKTIVTNVTNSIEGHKKNLDLSAEESKKKLIEAADQLENLLKSDVTQILSTTNGTLNKLKDFLSNSDDSTISVMHIKNGHRNFLISIHILMIPLYIMVIICCIFIYYFAKGDEAKSNKLIIKSTGLFSAYCGILALLIMIFTLIFALISMVVSTTCILTEQNVFSNKGTLGKNVSNIPIVNTCFENRPIVDEEYINGILDKVNGFDSKTITSEMDKFLEKKKDVVATFENNFKAVEDKLWLVQVNHASGDLHSQIKNEAVKAFLLLTHIYKENVGNLPGVYGVDTFLEKVNPILFKNSHAFCYEDVTCQNDTKKYNITKDSTTGDSNYTTFRNSAAKQINGGGAGDYDSAGDADIVLQILAYKAKILHEHIFVVSDLDPNQQDKLSIQQYIAPNKESEKNVSFINNWLLQLLDEIKNPKHLTAFKSVVETFAETNDYTILQIKRYTKKLTCQVVMVDMKKIIQHFCAYAVPGIGHVTVLYFVMGIFFFLLWLYFLCLWLHHKMILEREAEKDD